MKNIIHLAVLGLLVLCSCGGGNSDTRRILDSLREADSLASLQASMEAAEAARLDSLRLDSIDHAEQVLANIPSYAEIDKRWYDEDALKKFFRSRGFIISSVKGQSFDNETGSDVTVNYLVASYNTQSSPSCVYKREEMGWSFTINGAPELLDKFYAAAKASIAKYKRESGGDWWAEQSSATKNGNTVTLSYPGD